MMARAYMLIFYIWQYPKIIFQLRSLGVGTFRHPHGIHLLVSNSKGRRFKRAPVAWKWIAPTVPFRLDELTYFPYL